MTLLLGTLAVCYALLVVVVYIYQDALLYFPPQITANEARQFIKVYKLKPFAAGNAGTSAKSWENVAWTPIAEPPSGANRGTIIVAHGNAGSALGSLDFAEALVPLGFRVILYEYPGYGTNPGIPSEEGNVAPLRELVREVAATTGKPVYLFGQSLGCGVVCSALRDKTLPVQGVVLLQPWDSLAGVGGLHFPYLPVSLIVGGKYNSLANLANFIGPVAFIVCEKDVTIPPTLSRHVYDAYPGKKTWLEHPNCDHNTWPSDPALPWWKTVTDFIAPQER